MAKYIFNLPDVGEGIAEAEIVAFHVKVGDRIEEDQPVADMMTDKATVEMESPVAGIILRVAGEVGDVIAIGSMLIEVETDAEEVGVATVDSGVNAAMPISQESVEPTPQPLPVAAHQDVQSSDDKEQKNTINKIDMIHSSATASPAVRARAKALQINLSDVKAAGGHVRHSDLDAYLSYQAGQGYHAPGAASVRGDETIKVIGMRRRIAENMAASKRHIPHFSYVDECDVTAIESMRADLNEARGARPKLTLLPLMIAAICKAMPQFPMMNARYDDEAGVVTRYGAVHMGMAVQTDAGLMVPVIRDAQNRNIWQLAAEISRLADAARAGTAKSEELSGSTITITSLGPLGGIATTPVINRPEVAIIGPNKIIERPVFIGDSIEARKLMNISISCDHRVVDGWDAASFVQAIKKYLETPVLLFAD